MESFASKEGWKKSIKSYSGCCVYKYGWWRKRALRRLLEEELTLKGVWKSMWSFFKNPALNEKLKLTIPSTALQFIPSSRGHK